jgi:hypothetical protein
MIEFFTNHWMGRESKRLSANLTFPVLLPENAVATLLDKTILFGKRGKSILELHIETVQRLRRSQDQSARPISEPRTEDCDK